MMKQIITVKMRPDRNGGKLDKQIEASVFGGYAIHQSLDFPDAAHAHTVTHIKSGLACGTFSTQEKAKKRIKILQQIQIGGVKLTDMPACEALACWPAIHQEYIRLTGQEFDEHHYDRSLKVAHDAADILACAAT